MIGTILSWLTGGGLKFIASELRQAHRDRLEAQTDTAKLAADERIAQGLHALEAQTRGRWTWLPKLVRGLWDAPLILYLWKLVVWDKMLGWGATDPLGQFEHMVATAALSFYFVDATLSRLRR